MKINKKSQTRLPKSSHFHSSHIYSRQLKLIDTVRFKLLLLVNQNKCNFHYFHFFAINMEMRLKLIELLFTAFKFKQL
jgi:hypothetical protein